MPASPVEGNSLLAVDVGAVTTRAALFDVVEGQYRFIAAGRSPTTAEAPLRDIGIGIQEAIRDLQKITGHTFLDPDGRPIVPSQADGSGVDVLVATLSVGPAVRAIAIGLLSEVSASSARRLAETAGARIVETISLNDARRPEERMDAILRARPQLVLIAGGSDQGATRALERLTEIVGLASYLIPEEERPAVLFAGNRSLGKEVKATLQPLASHFTVCPNVRPVADTEDLIPAARELARLVPRIRGKQFKGITELEAWAGGHLMTSAYARGRIIRFLSKIYAGSGKGVLGVDVGASATTIAAAFDGDLALSAYPQFGIGDGLPGLLRHTDVESIRRWLPMELPASAVRDLLYQKSLYPGTLPATKEDLALEQAIAREVLSLALRRARPHFPRSLPRRKGQFLPPFEPILVGGSVIAHAPTFGQRLLMALDSLQPMGVTTLILDQNALLPMLGAAAEVTSILPVHVLESGAFVNMATVVSLTGPAVHGATVLTARLVRDDGSESRADVKSGSLEVLPLPSGQTARLHLRPRRRTDVGAGPGRGLTVQVVGGVLGVVIDARGRPLTLPGDPVRRRELMKKWLWTLGG